MESGQSDSTTRGVRVRVGGQYLPERSDPDRQRYLFAYRVILVNEGQETVKLLSRHWIVRDALNEANEVRGAGVVGKFPELAPGESFEYVSGCPLPTPWGTMEGSYRMRSGSGAEFDVAIGRFFLAPNTAPLSDLRLSRRKQRRDPIEHSSSATGPADSD